MEPLYGQSKCPKHKVKKYQLYKDLHKIWLQDVKQVYQKSF